VSEVVVTGIGLCCSLGDSLEGVIAALSRKSVGVEASTGDLCWLPISGVARCVVDVRPLLKRRKDRKLLQRAAHLAIVAAHQAYGDNRSSETALFMGVGREPPEEETETALILSMSDGKLDPSKLYTEGVAAYPPLSPLKTLPNLVLAHVAIQLDCMGEGGTRAGSQAAGLAAIVAGYHAISEGRSDVVLAGAADSLVAPGVAREALRIGQVPRNEAPGEAAVFFRLESGERARSRGAVVLAVLTGVSSSAGQSDPWLSPLRAQVGHCGTADAPLWLAVQMALGHSGEVCASERTGACSTVSWLVSERREAV
jgi:3-oxoacyl-[acyl-carrier-protein] synthase II